MNTLSLDEKSIFVEAHESEYIDQLTKLGFEVIRSPMTRPDLRRFTALHYSGCLPGRNLRRLLPQTSSGLLVEKIACPRDGKEHLPQTYRLGEMF